MDKEDVVYAQSSFVAQYMVPIDELLADPTWLLEMITFSSPWSCLFKNICKCG